MGGSKNFTSDMDIVIDALSPGERVNDMVDRHFSLKGVSWDLNDFGQVLDEENIIDSSNDANVVVGRQVPTGKVETAVYMGVAHELDQRIDGDVELRIPPFTRDMMVKNPEKLSYLNMPFIQDGEMSEVSLGSITSRKTIGSHVYAVNGQNDEINEIAGLNIPKGEHGLVPIHNSIIDGDITCAGDISNMHSRVIEEMIQNNSPPTELWMENPDGTTERLSLENGEYRSGEESVPMNEVVDNGFLCAQDAYDLIIYPTSLAEDTIYMVRDGVPSSEKFYSSSAGKLEAGVRAASRLDGFPILDVGEPAEQAPQEIIELLEDSRINQDRRFGDDTTVHVSVYPTGDQWKEYREELGLSTEPGQDAEQVASEYADLIYSKMI